VVGAKGPFGTQDQKNVETGKIQEYDWNACENRGMKNRGILLEGVFGFV